MSDETSKSCTKCGEIRLFSDFPVNKAKKDGYDAICKSCMRLKNKEQYRKHAEKRRHEAKTYREAHSQERSEYNKQYREAHREELIAHSREWRKTHKANRSEESKARAREQARLQYAENEDIRLRAQAAARSQRERLGKEVLRQQQNEWRQANPDKVKAYQKRTAEKFTTDERKQYYKERRVTYRVQRQVNHALYNARRKDADGVIDNNHLYMLHKWQDHCCFYCRENLDGHETIEHIVPLCRDGTNNPYNVALACSRCNTSKQGKIYWVEWKPEFVAEAPRFHSLYATQQLCKLLNDASVSFINHGDHVQICDRHIFILSSFWLGWVGDGVIKSLSDTYHRGLFFFDKEFISRPDAIVNVLKAKAGIAGRTGARKLMLTEPSIEEAKNFIGQWHALGFTSGTHYLGLRDKDKWWAIAAFRKDIDHYEVVRMAFRDTVAGGVSRIISHFSESNGDGLPIYAFTDKRMGDGASHFPAGFDAAGTTERSFFYATPEWNGFKARRNFQKSEIARRSDFFDEQYKQIDLARANGLMRVEGLQLLRFIRNA
ncbi:MAG: HNH endonuclease [Patescibacteria group bacterium]|nr:HNH endonuclease [Patescibacteria group bacterium]